MPAPASARPANAATALGAAETSARPAAAPPAAVAGGLALRGPSTDKALAVGEELLRTSRG